MSNLYNGSYGIKIFKPASVEHSITADEFCEILTQYCSERFKLTADFKVGYNNEHGLPELDYSNIKPVNAHDTVDYAHAKLGHWGFRKDDAIGNFDIAVNSMFGLDSRVFSYEAIEDNGEITLLICNSYDEFVKHGGDKATRESQ